MPILQQIRGLSPENGGTRPIIDTTVDDRRLARLGLFDAGLRHAVDPQSWVTPSPVDFRDKASGRRVRSNIPPAILDSALFNGRRAMDFTGIPTSTDMRIKGSQGTPSLTWVFVGTRPAVGRSAYSLCTSLRASSFMQQMRLSPDGNFYFSNVGGGAANINSVPVANLPPQNELHVYGVSYDDASRESAMFVDNGLTPARLFTHPVAANWSALDEVCIGGVGQSTGGSTGWLAHIGRVFVFDRALHVYNPSVMASLFEALRDIYGI